MHLGWGYFKTSIFVVEPNRSQGIYIFFVFIVQSSLMGQEFDVFSGENKLFIWNFGSIYQLEEQVIFLLEGFLIIFTKPDIHAKHDSVWNISIDPINVLNSICIPCFLNDLLICALNSRIIPVLLLCHSCRILCYWGGASSVKNVQNQTTWVLIISITFWFGVFFWKYCC